jgi:phosphoserine phosphatase
MGKIKLIAFDLDGVLVDGCGSWQEVHKALGTYDVAEKHANEYYAGKITFDEWARKDTKLWYGVDIGRVKDALYNVDLMRGIEETIPRLREHYRLAIISGGLQILADRVKDRFNMDYAIANRLLTEDGKICGIHQEVDFKGKGRILRKIAKSSNILLRECAAVGDYFNDIPMFKVAGFNIAFDPKDDEIVKYADEIIYEKDLTKILPYFNSTDGK